MAVKVYKFGGASVKDAASVENVARIIREHKGNDHLLVVISAMGKTTNALEVLVNKAHGFEDFETEFQELRNYHFTILHDLFRNSLQIREELDEVFDELKITLQSHAHEEYNFLYDQVVSQGEIISTRLVAAYLKSAGLDAEYRDARGLIRTDTTYREGKVNWSLTSHLVQQNIVPVFESNPEGQKIIITQGFIGKSSEDSTVTLGREGSDYSAAIFAHILDATEVTIWKDVPGVLNADPKYFADAQMLNQLSYRDAIELAYYGATVIHPKTIKPLQNKKIPLRVRSFINPSAQGTTINEHEPLAVIPSFIFKVRQALISISPLDFSFIIEENMSHIFGLLARYRVKVNLMQHSAVSFMLCVDNDPMKVPDLLSELSKSFEVNCTNDIELITVRYYNEATVDRLLRGKEVLAEQKNSHTIRLAVKEKL